LQRDDVTDAEKEALIEQARDEFQAEFAPGVETDVIGEGFETVITMNQLPEAFPMEMLSNELLADLSTDVDGGVVFGTPLGNTLITDAGEVFAGAVSVEYLLDVASR